MSLYYLLTNGSMKCFEYILPFVDKCRDFMCINAVQVDHDQELFFFLDICQTGFVC